MESIPPGKYIFTQESTKIIKFQYTLIKTSKTKNENCLVDSTPMKYQSTLYDWFGRKEQNLDFRIKFYFWTVPFSTQVRSLYSKFYQILIFTHISWGISVHFGVLRGTFAVSVQVRAFISIHSRKKYRLATLLNLTATNDNLTFKNDG